MTAWDEATMAALVDWRTRADVERDVLVALLTIPAFRMRVLLKWRRVVWTTGDHRLVAATLARGPAPDPTEAIEWVADVLACNRESALEWALAGNPVSYDDDLDRLLSG